MMTERMGLVTTRISIISRLFLLDTLIVGGTGAVVDVSEPEWAEALSQSEDRNYSNKPCERRIPI